MCRSWSSKENTEKLSRERITASDQDRICFIGELVAGQDSWSPESKEGNA